MVLQIQRWPTGGIAVNNENYKRYQKGILTLYKTGKRIWLNEKYSTRQLYSRLSPEYVVNIYKTYWMPDDKGYYTETQ